MLRFGRRDSPATSGGGDEDIAPEPLTLSMDPERFRAKFARLLDLLGDVGGVDPFLAALGNKRRLFQGVLDPDVIEALDREKIGVLLDTVMPARRRLGSALAQMDETRLTAAVRDLLYGDAPMGERLGAFVDVIPLEPGLDERTGKKVKRAAHDFAAELLHFRAPERYPLMTRWVWDKATLSGAMREMIKGSDTLHEIPWSGNPGAYEAGRQWVAQQMAEQGVYREPFFIVDLFFAHVYTDYMNSLSSGMGLIQADFGGKGDPMEVVTKLLGIDETPHKGSRSKKATLH